MTRALVQFHLTLAIARPAELDHALEPARALLLESVQAAADAGSIRADIAPERLTRILMSTGISAIHTAVTQSDSLPARMPEEIWQFCLSGIIPSPR